MLKATVIVTLKQEVSDPQGFAVFEALRSLGMRGLQGVRVGKQFEIQLDGLSRAEAEKELHEVSAKLLSNPVIEDYRFEITEA
ncbi:MAG: phosphoribosylformylglycinamidine synthase subunit PurS [Candidatus Sumerlaeota bacterium]|nr:phosphoribosylformylglycinamidine synthase subunit PurS [Candidatus Sumerlaeota bacterium]